jgi:short-subunit dehydrogenase
LDAITNEISSSGGKADAYQVDLADPHAVASTALEISTTYGAPDILVNNAGAGRWLPIVETTAEEAARMVAVPYLAAFNITREFLGGMIARGTGNIVNVTSVAARLVWPGAVAYTSARWAMEGFTTALRADLFGSGIRVTLALFGTVESSYWEHNPGSRERLPRKAGQIRVLTTEEAADAIISGIENGKRAVIKPAIYRLLFMFNALFPKMTESMMCSKELT